MEALSAGIRGNDCSEIRAELTGFELWAAHHCMLYRISGDKVSVNRSGPAWTGWAVPGPRSETDTEGPS